MDSLDDQVNEMVFEAFRFPTPFSGQANGPAVRGGRGNQANEAESGLIALVLGRSAGARSAPAAPAELRQGLGIPLPRVAPRSGVPWVGGSGGGGEVGGAEAMSAVLRLVLAASTDPERAGLRAAALELLREVRLPSPFQSFSPIKHVSVLLLPSCDCGHAKVGAYRARSSARDAMAAARPAVEASLGAALDLVGRTAGALGKLQR